MSTIINGSSPSVTFSDGTTQTTAFTSTPSVTALVNGGNTITVPAVAGTMMVSGNMPAFSVYLSTSQSMTSATNTKVQFNTKLYDTANCFDNTTNYRFTPNVAGYYQFNLKVQTGGTPGDFFCAVQKNGGTEVYRGIRGNTGLSCVTVSTIVYLNGSTDYVEGYVYQTATSINRNTISSGDQSWFNGALIRAA